MNYDLKKLMADFNMVAQKNGQDKTFTALLDFGLGMFDVFDRMEAISDAIKEIDHPDKQAIFTAMIEEIARLSNGTGKGYGDAIGQLFMELAVNKKQLGQVYTPDEMAELMAMISVSTNPDQKTINDPAVGSGRTLLAAARINRNLIFYGGDIDLNCVKMTTFNFLLNSLTGEVAHMDSLRYEIYSVYRTGTILRKGMHIPYWEHFTDVKKSDKPPEKITANQKKEPHKADTEREVTPNPGTDIPITANPQSGSPDSLIQGQLF